MPRVRKMPRRSVSIDDLVEEYLQKARGLLISTTGRDVDNTRAINIFSLIGAIRYYYNANSLTETENKVINILSKETNEAEYNSFMDELGSMLLKLVEKNVKTTTKTVPQ